MRRQLEYQARSALLSVDISLRARICYVSDFIEVHTDRNLSGASCMYVSLYLCVCACMCVCVFVFVFLFRSVNSTTSDHCMWMCMTSSERLDTLTYLTTAGNIHFMRLKTAQSLVSFFLRRVFPSITTTQRVVVLM